jgi:hypothetical protein
MWATGAIPIGAPGWPELAFSTFSSKESGMLTEPGFTHIVHGI